MRGGPPAFRRFSWRGVLVPDQFQGIRGSRCGMRDGVSSRMFAKQRVRIPRNADPLLLPSGIPALPVRRGRTDRLPIATSHSSATNPVPEDRQTHDGRDTDTLERLVDRVPDLKTVLVQLRQLAEVRGRPCRTQQVP